MSKRKKTYTQKQFDNALTLQCFDEVGGLFWKDEDGEYHFPYWPRHTPCNTDAELEALKEKLGGDAPEWLTRCKDLKHMQAYIMKFSGFLHALEDDGCVEEFMEKYRTARAQQK